ncbi:MAG: hypothetical protein H0V73_09915 [Chloroflexi bacterium]|nr:hypothetical protein [Chloroflexota bacterium]
MTGDRPPAPARPTGGPADPGPPPVAEQRPWLERLGLAAIAAVMGGLLAFMAYAAGTGGEWILATMSGAGAILTLGVGLSTLIRG